MKRQQGRVGRKRKIQVSALVGLVAVLLILMVGRLFDSSEVNAASGDELTVSSDITVRPGQTLSDAPPPTFTPDWPVAMARDPFAWDDRFPVPEQPVLAAPPPTAPRADVKIKLQGIVHNESPWAIINGAIVRVGDFVGDVRVVRIEERFILVEREGVQWKVEL